MLHKARPNKTRISVDRALWPDIVISTPRVFGVFKRWVSKSDETLRVAWDDGDGTHPLEHLIAYGFASEEGMEGEPVLEFVVVSCGTLPRWRIADTSSCVPSTRRTARDKIIF